MVGARQHPPGSLVAAGTPAEAGVIDGKGPAHVQSCCRPWFPGCPGPRVGTSPATGAPAALGPHPPGRPPRRGKARQGAEGEREAGWEEAVRGRAEEGPRRLPQTWGAAVAPPPATARMQPRFEPQPDRPRP